MVVLDGLERSGRPVATFPPILVPRSLHGANLWDSKKMDLTNISEYAFPNFCPLDAGFPYFGPEIRILREFSYLEPDSHVWNRIYSLKNLKSIISLFF